MSKGALLVAGVALILVVGVGAVAFAAPASSAGGAPPPPPPPVPPPSSGGGGGDDFTKAIHAAAGAVVNFSGGVENFFSKYLCWSSNCDPNPLKQIVCPSVQPGVKVGLSLEDWYRGQVFLRTLGKIPAYPAPVVNQETCDRVKALYNYGAHKFPWQ